MEIARYLIAFVAVFNFGGLVADAQTMLMGLVSGTLSLVLLFGRPLLTLSRDNLETITL